MTTTQEIISLSITIVTPYRSVYNFVKFLFIHNKYNNEIIHLFILNLQNTLNGCC